LTFSDGKLINATWDNDSMNGEGTIIEKGVTRHVTFYKDLELNTDSSNCYNNVHWNLLLVIIFWALLLTGISNPYDYGFCFPLAFFFYIGGLVNMCVNKTISQLGHVGYAEDSVAMVNDLVHKPPHV